MEYKVYLVTKYLDAGKIEAHILSAFEAESLGYEDGHKERTEDSTLFVDGFNSERSCRMYLDGLVNCTVHSAKQSCKKAQQER